MKKLLLMIIILISLTSSITAASTSSIINDENSPVQFFAEYEKGFVSVLAHTIQIGDTGTKFNYVTQGGQDILFPFERYNLGAVLYDRHRISFLFQPLELNTTVPFESAVKIDGKTFGSDTAITAMNLKYGFPFWRVSYSYDLLKDKDRTLAIGLSLQIRDASIVFKAVDGSEVAVSQNVGPVPALHIYSMWKTSIGLNLSADITGSYASSAFINGANFNFEGSLLDASLRAGYQLKNNIEIFSNIRFLGGSAKGSSSYAGTNWSVASSDGRYTENNLATLAVTMGFTIR